MAEALPLVVIADPIDAASVERLRAAGRCRVADVAATPEALVGQLADAWGLVVRSRTKVTAELLQKAPKLAVVGRAGVGVDNVDMAAASARGIRVFNAPTAATASVAELTVLLLLLLARDLYPAIEGTKAGKWPKGGLGTEIEGKTIGFIGYGRIAREAAKRLAPFHPTLLAFDPFVPRVDDGTTLVPLDELLQRSDYVSLHAALTPENRHLLNAGRLGSMKRGARIVNVARGALIDEGALLDALESGAVGGAALDVFEVEPPTRTALLAHPKVVATPHVGAATREGQSRAGALVVDELLRALKGEPLTSLVSPTPGVSA
ncbi:MAG TPA: hydroxyacid dehydrogenase [Thermoplasmata archaeon]|nr:hydroxyacid dehydrogenase [Thermoplasmata archaeon]